MIALTPIPNSTIAGDGGHSVPRRSGKQLFVREKTESGSYAALHTGLSGTRVPYSDGAADSHDDAARSDPENGAQSIFLKLRRHQESIHFLGVLRGELCLRTTAEFGIPSLKSGAEFVIEDVHAHLQ
jgi:hypothetical protein